MLTLSGCVGDEDVRGYVEVAHARSETAISSELKSVNGTYSAGCTDRSGAALDHEQLTVVLHETGCVLTLTGLHTSVANVEADPAIVLGTSFATDGSAFAGLGSIYALIRAQYLVGT